MKSKKRKNGLKEIFVFLSIILLGVFYSCTNSTKSNPNSISFERNLTAVNLEKNDNVSIYDFFSKIEIIPLETNSNSLLTFPIGEPDRVIVNERKYYFLDDMQQAIIVFDEDGKFLNKIDHKGMGPEEYVSIKDFNINRFTKNIEILSPQGGYINIYDASGNTFIERLRFPSDMPTVHFFHHLTPDTYTFLSIAREVEMLFYSKKDNKFIKNSYNLPQWVTRSIFSPSKNPFYIYNDTLCYSQMYNGSVFEISPADRELNFRYSWDFGKNNFDLLSIFSDEESREGGLNSSKISMNYAILFLVYKENLNYYFTRFKFKNRHIHLVLNKITGEYFLFEKFAEGGQLLPMWLDENAAYTFVPPAYLHLVINQSVLDEENKLKYNQIKEDDNPVVIKYTLK